MITHKGPRQVIGAEYVYRT